ncbi:hypothetical protein I2I05_05950 [Hymenobacter sp. BT683]|uniref:Uncharacterized protein n=1 Tax=Hymenobacter jeongseonensis TaxID=2791027 RepID=A0ABS0IG84_9BACT|nr:hypothetical protein [Hymenobacter jeongseonensis]MBF9236933.1 hypothetical protein [Hymenobacter jeongseonensis]
MQPTLAQDAGRSAGPGAEATDENLTFNQTFGFGEAVVLTPEGKTHTIYIPLSGLGFGNLLPYYKREEDITNFGAQPLFISVDKVQAITCKTTGLYLEHMVLKGKRQHVLGARVEEGPVELFNYTQTKHIPAGSSPIQTTYIVYPKRHWYLRRQGELVEVSRGGFVEQLSAFFQDDPVVVAALAAKTLGYRDMRALVRMYNEHQTPAPSGLIPPK